MICPSVIVVLAVRMPWVMASVRGSSAFQLPLSSAVTMSNDSSVSVTVSISSRKSSTVHPGHSSGGVHSVSVP